MESSRLSRRDFVQTAVGAGLAIGAPAVLGAAQETGRTFKIALIGCGGRGRGAVTGALEAAKVLGVNVQVVALSDYFEDRARRAGEQFGCPADRCFGGATGYQAVMETDAEVVLTATPPLFRPLHLEAAVKAGKHAFIEKPVAVDPPGCRRVIAAGEEAKQKGQNRIAAIQPEKALDRNIIQPSK